MRGFMQLDIPQGDFAGYLFDLDGTLVDTMPIHFVAWRKALWQCGLERDLEEDSWGEIACKQAPTAII